MIPLKKLEEMREDARHSRSRDILARYVFDLVEEVLRLRKRLECDGLWRLDPSAPDGKGTTWEPRDLPDDQDGIACRDVTIAMLEDELAERKSAR